jgi:hypothetical protein
MCRRHIKYIIILNALEAQIKNVDFVESGFIRLTDFTAVRYSVTNNNGTRVDLVSKAK